MRTTVALAVALFLIPTALFAAPVVRSGDSVSLKEGQTVEGDFYAVSGTMSLSGKIEGDAVIGGGNVTVNGEITDDLAVLAGSVNVHGPVGGAVRIIGGQGIVANHVGGDVVVLGGKLTILSTAMIEGDVLFYGGELEVKGEVAGTIYGSAGRADIDSTVGGDITLAVRSPLVLGPHANVEGDVVYTSQSELVRALDSVVVGEVARQDGGEERDSSFMSIFPLLAGLFSSFVALFLFSRFVVPLVTQAQRRFGACAFAGFGVFAVLPVIILLLSISIIGVGVAIAALSLYISMLVSSWALSGILAGSIAYELVKKKQRIDLLTTFIGVLLLYALLYIPYIGVLASLAFVFAMLGSMVLSLYEKIR